MIPDEQPKAASEPAQTPAKGHRRSRRGGRRYSRRDRPHEPVKNSTAATVVEPAEVDPVAETETPRIEERREPRPEREAQPKSAGVTLAIEQVTHIIEELKRALDEMDEVLETLELAERQKIDDEREIESLQRALRQLHRPSHGSDQNRR